MKLRVKELNPLLRLFGSITPIPRNVAITPTRNKSPLDLAAARALI